MKALEVSKTIVLSAFNEILDSETSITILVLLLILISPEMSNAKNPELVREAFVEFINNCPPEVSI